MSCAFNFEENIVQLQFFELTKRRQSQLSLKTCLFYSFSTNSIMQFCRLLCLLYGNFYQFKPGKMTHLKKI